MWVQDRVAEKRLPEEFLNCVPESLLGRAEDHFFEYDKSRYPEAQTEVAKRLLDLRVTFKENQKVQKKYRADIKLLNSDLILQLTSDDALQLQERKAGSISGIDDIKKSWLRSNNSDNIRYINVDKWKTMSNIEQLMLLTKLTKEETSRKFK